MNILLIISIILTIVAAGLYFMAKREVEKQKESVKYWMDRYEKEEKSNIEYSQINKILQEKYEQVAADFQSWKSTNSNIQKENISLKEELANLQQLILEREKSVIGLDSKLFKPVTTADFRIELTVFLEWNSLEVQLTELIEDQKLYEVFKSLLASGLLPESIQNTIDYQKQTNSVIIWAQEYDEEGEAIRALTWREITDQILTKKQIVTDYLKTVIQDSDRAMVVHQALSNKKGKEVAA